MNQTITKLLREGKQIHGKLNFSLTKIHRIAERNGYKRVLKLKDGLVSCECGDDLFIGVPCRHMIGVANKEPSIHYRNLPINERWRISYCIHPIEEIEAEFEISSIDEGQVEQIQSLKVKITKNVLKS